MSFALLSAVTNEAKTWKLPLGIEHSGACRRAPRAPLMWAQLICFLPSVIAEITFRTPFSAYIVYSCTSPNQLMNTFMGSTIRADAD